MTDADKAKTVWSAAFPRARMAPSPDLLDGLARDLARAAASGKMVTEPRPKREREHLERISAKAQDLAALLKCPTAIIDRIEHDWPNAGPDNSVSNVLFSVLKLAEAVDLALGADAVDEHGKPVRHARRRGSAILEEKFGSGGKLFVRRCAKSFEARLGKKPGLAWAVARTELDSPFIRFVQEAARQFGFDPPDGETIRRALDDRKPLK